MTSTILLWRDPAEGDLCGAKGLLRWRSYQRRAADEFFTLQGEPGQIAAMAKIALGEAFKRHTNVFVGWGESDPATTPAAEIEAGVRRLWPVTIWAPEREIGGDWAMSVFGNVAPLPRGSVERAISEFRKNHYPGWQPGLIEFRPHAAIVFVDRTAEQLGLVPRHVPTPDEIYSSVSTDPAVIEAGRRWDLRTPETHRDLVAAVLAAQERAGIPVADRVPLSSGHVEEYLTPLLMRMGRGEEADVVAQMRRDCRRLYGEFAEVVLVFMLKTYRHGGTEKLLTLATGAKEAA
jgi:hypothetical protein